MRSFLIFLSLIFILACAYDPTYIVSESASQLSIAVHSVSPSRARATTSEKYHFLITARDGTTHLDTLVMDNAPLFQLIVDHLKEDDGYVVWCWTTNSDGDTIHTPVSDTFDIVKDSTTNCTLSLLPRVGSLLLQLSEIPTSVDTISFTFESDSGRYSALKKRSSTLFLSLDVIPYGARGVVSVAGFDATADTTLWWSDTLTFMGGQSVEMSFSTAGVFTTALTVETPSNSVIVGTAGSRPVLREKNGGVYISEFCATAGSGSSSRDFVEIYNGSAQKQEFSALTLVVGTAQKQLGVVSLEAGEFLTVGSSAAHEVWGIDSLRTLDLTSTSGQLYLYDGSQLLDYLFYANDTAMAWPKLSSSAKKSWEYHGESTNAEGNNYPEYWQISQEEHAQFDGSSWCGTPGR